MFTPDPLIPIVDLSLSPMKMQPAHNPANFCFVTQENSATPAKAHILINFPNGFPDTASFSINSNTGAGITINVTNTWKPGLLPSETLTGNPDDTCAELSNLLNDHPDLNSLFTFYSAGLELHADAKRYGDYSLSVTNNSPSTLTFTVTSSVTVTGTDQNYGQADPNFTAYVEIYADLGGGMNPANPGNAVDNQKVDEMEKRFLDNGQNSTWLDPASVLRNYVETKNPQPNYGVYFDPKALLGYSIYYGYKRTYNYGTVNQYISRRMQGYLGEYFLLNSGLPLTTPSELLELEPYWKRTWTTTGQVNDMSRVVFSVRWSELDSVAAAGLGFNFGIANGGTVTVTTNGTFIVKDNPDDTFIDLLNYLLTFGPDYSASFQKISWDLAVFTVEAISSSATFNIQAPSTSTEPAIKVLYHKATSEQKTLVLDGTPLAKNLNQISDYHSTHYNERHIYSFIYAEEQELVNELSGQPLSMFYQYTTTDAFTSSVQAKVLNAVVDGGLNGVMHCVYSADWLGLPSSTKTFTVWMGAIGADDEPYLLFEPISHFLTYKLERTGRTLYWLNELGGWNDISLVSWEVNADRKSTLGEKPLSRQPQYTDTIRYIKELEVVETINAATRWVSQGKGNFSLEGDTDQAGFYGGLAKSTRVVLWNNTKQLFESILVKDVKWVRNQDEPVQRMELVLERTYFENNAK